MKYTKPPLSCEQQADQLISRGLTADRAFLISCLSEVNYYRLSGYCFPFREDGAQRFKPGTDFRVIWDHYVFDRQLRFLVMDGIERVEVSIGTRLVNVFALKYGAFGYLDRKNFHHMDVDGHRTFLNKIRSEADRSHEVFVKHFYSKYTSETDLPLWMAIELMPFGGLVTFFRSVEQHLQREVSLTYGLSAKVLASWLLTLNFVRNVCAHHGRLWNRPLPVRPLIPYKKNSPEFHEPIFVSPERMFAVLTILNYMVKRIAPQSGWQKRFEHLIEVKHSGVPLAQMGFPDEWKKSPIWEK